MEEAFAVGKAKGVALDPAYLDERMNFLASKVEPGMKASMAHDLERGNRLELDWLAGKVRALGRELGIPTPASDTVYTVLKLHRMGSHLIEETPAQGRGSPCGNGWKGANQTSRSRHIVTGAPRTTGFI